MYKKIAIYHDLRSGGAKNLLENLTLELDKKGIKFKIFTPIISNKHQLPIKLLNELHNLYLLNILDKIIARNIKKFKPDLCIVFPSSNIQSPNILRYTDPNTTLYLFFESKREFYETTDPPTLKSILMKIMRQPIKFIDFINCQSAKYIIACSFYSQYILKKIYDKDSTVIHPGFPIIDSQKIHLQNNNKYLSIGLHTYLKGHDLTIIQFSKSNKKVTIVGNKSHYTKDLMRLNQKYDSPVKFIYEKDNIKLQKKLKKYSFFIANQRKEPYGLTTLDAISKNMYVVGLNQSGTCEIVRHGLNGFLYQEDFRIMKKIISEQNAYKEFVIYTRTKQSWLRYTNVVLSEYNRLKNEPTE